jgi:hypothetical protein
MPTVYNGILANEAVHFVNPGRTTMPSLYLQQQFAAIVAEAEPLRQKQRESERELKQLFQLS